MNPASRGHLLCDRGLGQGLHAHGVAFDDRVGKTLEVGHRAPGALAYPYVCWFSVTWTTSCEYKQTQEGNNVDEKQGRVPHDTRD